MPTAIPDEIKKHLGAIKQAADSYSDTCGVLIAAHEAGRVPTPWHLVEEHGMHVLFENSETGQRVDAPDWGRHSYSKMDPWFFAVYVVTTDAFPLVRDLLCDETDPDADYYTACMMVDALCTLES